jgi:plastocyanin
MELARFALLVPLALPFMAHAQAPEYTIVIKEHRFQPAELAVPAGKRIKLVIDNQDATPEEFESKQLRVEKIVPGGTKGTVTVGPLKPGSYPFFGEFHEDTAQGKLHAK